MLIPAGLIVFLIAAAVYTLARPSGHTQTATAATDLPSRHAAATVAAAAAAPSTSPAHADARADAATAARTAVQLQNVTGSVPGTTAPASAATEPAPAPDVVLLSTTGRPPTPLGRPVTPPSSSARTAPPQAPRLAAAPFAAAAPGSPSRQQIRTNQPPSPLAPPAPPTAAVTPTLTTTDDPASDDIAAPSTAPESEAAAQVRALAARLTAAHHTADPAAAEAARAAALAARPVRRAVSPAVDPFLDFGRVYASPGATRIVYLVDASGSMIDTLPFVLAELQRAIRTLDSQQTFAVIFCSGRGITEVPPMGMKRATSQAVAHAARWIDPLAGRVIASGAPDAEAALRRALAYQPDAIVLLSDGITGRGTDAPARHAALLQLVTHDNPAATTLHTLQLRRPDPLATPQRPGTLQALAGQTGGTYHYLPESRLDP